MGMYGYIGENIKRIREECLSRAEKLGIPVPTLVAVTKSATDGEVSALVRECGQRDIAENRAALFNARFALFGESERPRMHLIGQLQTNKVKYIIGKTDLIHSLDSVRLAAELERQAAKRDLTVRVLAEINSGRETAKGGLMPEEAEAFVSSLAAYPHLSLCGLMTMGPVCDTAEGYRPFFRETAALFHWFEDAGYFKEKGILSMGMSGSYLTALEEGATLIRVGRALFAQ